MPRYTFFIPKSTSVTCGMRLVRLISEANLSESRRANGKLNCDGERQLARERQKAQAEAQEPEPETLRLNESGLSSDHYTANNTRRFVLS